MSGHRMVVRLGGAVRCGDRPGPGRRRCAERDRGSFTAELAAGLPALVLLLLAGLTAVSGVATRAHCTDAARDAALAAARGEARAPAGAGEAPPGAVVSVTVEGDRVTATCRAPVRALGGRLPALTVVDRAVAALEPGESEPFG
jgi:Flp pilus assembly protein TadG